MVFIILIFCCFRNYTRAKTAQLSAGLWAVYTLLAMFVAMFIGSLIMMTIMIVRDPLFKALLLQQPQDRQRVLDYVEGHNLILSEVFLLFCGLGGYLFVRHLLLRKKGPVGDISQD